jgi:cellulose biosynthesis protein BcsQ
LRVLNLLTSDVLAAAPSSPCRAEYFALEGISELISTLERVRAAFNPEVSIEGVLLTMYDDLTDLSHYLTSSNGQSNFPHGTPSESCVGSTLGGYKFPFRQGRCGQQIWTRLVLSQV